MHTRWRCVLAVKYAVAMLGREIVGPEPRKLEGGCRGRGDLERRRVYSRNDVEEKPPTSRLGRPLLTYAEAAKFETGIALFVLARLK